MRVSLGSYADLVLVDVRTFMELRDSVRRATKKGVRLKVERLPELIAALELAHAEVVTGGLLRPCSGLLSCRTSHNCQGGLGGVVRVLHPDRVIGALDDPSL